ncbi:hypothetical protein F5B22DRAFT_617810 [Xylaria bambusicola]|uniref:uncharacterized protein n=1 Tax=Xylaria bambusicola TaxID=326684 RepID=UPI002008815A|nr:uncharacterized protein F5B22DRAFT_617810 [Xylaria bambusicola]KAI0509347.1 hypothetical protein F5B22DRAFT_617810 [Xylaria bambusicola]
MFSISVRSISRAISGIICLAIVILLSLQAQFLIPIITEDGSPFTPAARTSSAPQNYYTLLNITVNATERDIKRAYHRQVLFIHPDKLQRLNASVREEGKRRFDAMTQAFEVLTSDRRCKYDLDVMGVGLGRYSRCLEDRWERRRAERARKVAAEHEQEAVREEEREGYQGI